MTRSESPSIGPRRHYARCCDVRRHAKQRDAKPVMLLEPASPVPEEQVHPRQPY